MSATARDLLTWAAAQIGTLEQPVGSNKQPYAAMADHTNGLAWCATFLVAGWKANGVARVPGTDTAWTPGMRSAFRTAGRLHDEPRPGDVGHVFYPNLDGGRIGHVFFVERVSGDHVESIEGNTNRDGSRRGVGVFRSRRRWRNGGAIRGFGRPLYRQDGGTPTVDLSRVIHAARNDPSGPQGATSFPADVRIVEAALMAEGLLSPTFAKDGSFGKLTVAAFSQWQRVCGFTGDDADGIPGRRSLTQLGLRHGFLVKE
jgi:CHAP domain